MMDAQERVLTTLAHEEPDKVPAFESTFTNNSIMKELGIKPNRLGPLLNLIHYFPFRNKIIQKAFTIPSVVKKGFEGLVKFYVKAKLDMINSISALFPRLLVRGGFVDEFGRHMHYEQYRDGTEVLGYVGGHFKSFEDYESWELPDPQWDARVAGFIAGQELQQKYGGKIFAVPGITGLMEVTWEGFGFELFSRILAKRTQARKIFDDRGKFTNEVVKVLAERGARCVLIFDDYAFKNGPFMSPKQYKEYVFPWLKTICSTAHQRDCKVILHSDGDLALLLDDLVNDCKIDALNPIEPTTANKDYDIFKIHDRYGSKITLVGNVSPTMLATGDVDEIREYTTRLIREIAPGGGYILASGHSINPAVTYDRWQAMMDVREQLGNYPIKA